MLGRDIGSGAHPGKMFLLKIIKLMLISDHVRLSKGWLFPTMLEKKMMIKPHRVREPPPPQGLEIGKKN